MILKVMGKHINHVYLKRRLSLLWRLLEEMTLIDLGNDYFIAKLYKEENANKILPKGPWFVNEFFLSVKRWHPNFVASKATKTHSAI